MLGNLPNSPQTLYKGVAFKDDRATKTFTTLFTDPQSSSEMARYWIPAYTSRIFKWMSVLGDFRQFFNACLGAFTCSECYRKASAIFVALLGSHWLGHTDASAWNSQIKNGSLHKGWTGGCRGLTPAGSWASCSCLFTPLVWWGRELEE